MPCYFLKQICIYSFPRKILKKVFRQNSKSNLENFEDGYGLDILASHERLYHHDNSEMLQAISTINRSRDNKQSNKLFTQSLCLDITLS